MTCRINALATGTWSARVGEPVTVVGVAPNGLATAILVGDAKKPAYVPTRWLDGLEPAPDVCPTCGQVLP